MTLHSLKLRMSPTANSLFRLVTVLLISLGQSILGAEERMVFHSDRVGNAEIYVTDVDGENFVRLTKNPAFDINPACSPDGGKIAFVSNRAGGSEIFVMNPDGTNPLRLTNDLARADNPCWSPDGAKIAFSSTRDGNYEIYVMDADGTNLVRLTHHEMLDDSPSWSPDGRRIAFESNRDGGFAFKDIFVMDADGKNPINLTINPEMFLNIHPAWSPHEDKIAFQTRRDGDINPEIYVMNPRGKRLMRLTDGRGGAAPAWSPDGSKIAFVSNRDGDGNIYVMDADGHNIVRLTETLPGAWDSSPCWLFGGTFAVAPRKRWHAYWGRIKQTVTLFDSYESKTNNEPRTKE